MTDSRLSRAHRNRKTLCPPPDSYHGRKPSVRLVELSLALPDLDPYTQKRIANFSPSPQNVISLRIMSSNYSSRFLALTRIDS